MSNILRIFNKMFNVQENLESEKTKFVNRVNQTIFNKIENFHEYESIFKTICYWLGENANDMIRAINSFNYGMSNDIPRLRSLTSDDYTRTLRILCLLYLYFSKDQYGYEEKREEISGWTEVALSNSNLDLGIEWKDGMFYPKGAGVLDQKLIEDPLDWLNNFQEVKEDYKKALSNYLKKNYPDVIDQCYLVIEGLVRKIFDNKKTLDNNKADLLKKLKLSQQWKSILDKFIDYSNEFKRHASSNRKLINPDEVEAFLYLTGLLVRLIINIK